MPRTRTAPRRGRDADFQIRTVKTKEDRKRPSIFMRLKPDESFKGIALFEPDPEVENNPGYFEYYSHWDQQGNTYVPCAGDKCPFCAANMNPSTQALTAWYFPHAGDVKDQIKVFTMNYSTTQEASDESEDEGGVLGKVVRLKRLSEKGDYRFKVTTDKGLTKTELKKVMAQLEEKFPDGLRGLIMSQLRREMERLKALEAMEDDDDYDDEAEEETPAPKARRGRPAAAAPVEEEDEEEEADEDEEDEDEDEDEAADAPGDDILGDYEILSVSKRNGTITVEHDDEEILLYASEDTPIDGFKKGDAVTLAAAWTEDDDEEGYWLLAEIEEATEEEEPEDEDEADEEDEAEEDDEDTDDEEDEGEDEDEEAEEKISTATYEVVAVQERDEILTVKGEDNKRIKMWVGEGVEPDYDAVVKGAQVVVDAERDEEGDWIVTALEMAEAPKARPTRRTPKRRTARRGA